MNSCDYLNNPHGTGPSHLMRLDAVPEKPLRVALYARVSTISQMDSLETQIQILKAEAARRGMEVVLEAREIISGKARKMPKRESLVESSKRMAIDAVMVLSLERFGRSMVGVLNAWEALKEAGVNFISVNEGIDISTPAGKMMGGIFALTAEQEWHMICDRSRQGRFTAKLKGVKLGRPRTIPEETSNAIMQGLGMGKTQMELASQYNVSQSAIHKINKRREQLLQISPKCIINSPPLDQPEDSGLQGFSVPPEAAGETGTADVACEIQDDPCGNSYGEPSGECKLLPQKWYPIPVSGVIKLPMALHHGSQNPGKLRHETGIEELLIAGDSYSFYPV